MNTLHDHPSLPIDPDRIFVTLKLADAQRLAKHLEGMTTAKHFEGIPLGEVVDMYAPLVEGIRAALNDGQQSAVKALGLSAIKAEEDRRAKEAKPAAGLLEETSITTSTEMIEEIERQMKASDKGGSPEPGSQTLKDASPGPVVNHYVDGKPVTAEEQTAVSRSRDRLEQVTAAGQAEIIRKRELANRGIKDGAGKRNTG